MTSRSTRSSTRFADRSLWRIAGWPLPAIAVALAGFYFAGRSGTDPSRYTNDFNVFYHAAREVNAGRDPYQDSLGPWTPYLYPPLLAQLLAPIAQLPLPVAAYIWFAINAAALIGAATLSARLACGMEEDGADPNDKSIEDEEARRRVRRMLVAAGAIAVVFRFALDSFDLGQVNALVAGFVAAHVYFCAKQRRFASALMFVLAASIKLTPLLLIVYHLARRRVRFAVACAGLFVLITTISFSVYGSQAPAAFSVFLHRTVMNEQGFDFAYVGNQSLRGAIARIESPGPLEYINESPVINESRRRPGSPSTLAAALALLSVAVIAGRRHRADARYRRAEVSADYCDDSGESAGRKPRVGLTAVAPFVCLLVLLSPLSWKAHFVLLVIPAAALIARTFDRTREAGTERNRRQASAWTRRKIATRVMVVIVFSLFNLTSPRVVGLAAAEWADAHSLVCIGALVLFAANVLGGWIGLRPTIKLELPGD